MDAFGDLSDDELLTRLGDLQRELSELNTQWIHTSSEVVLDERAEVWVEAIEVEREFRRRHPPSTGLTI